MTTVTSATATTTTATATQTEQAASALSSDFETFLKMLTVQMQNQDPLNPIESSDYALQLATFSGVEQAVLTNELITGLSEQLGVIGMSQTASWVGKEVKSEAPAYFDGDPIELSIDSSGSGDTSYLIVRNEAGTKVQEIEIDSTATSYEWSGLDDDAYAFSTGYYTFSVENYTNGTYSSGSEVYSNSTVTEARRDGGDITLVLEGGYEIGADDVLAVREAA